MYIYGGCGADRLGNCVETDNWARLCLLWFVNGDVGVFSGVNV